MSEQRTWQNRIVGHGEEDPMQLAANPRNYRLHGEQQQNALAGVLDEVGWVAQVTVNQRTGYVVDGHLRVLLAMQRDEKAVPVTYVDLSEDEERLILATLDPLSAMAGTDKEVLADLLAAIGEQDGAVGALLDDLAKNAGLDTTKGGLTDPDDVPEPPKKPVTKPGDLWVLGDHRLLCGDARSADDVSRLCDEASVDLAFTSPPYAEQRSYDSSSGFTPIPPDKYVEWFGPVAENVVAHLAGSGSWCININAHADAGQRVLYVYDLVTAHVRNWGWMLVDEFVWVDTKGGVPGAWPNRFKDGWEPVFHFSRDAKIKFRPLANGRDSDSVFSYSPQTAKAQTGSGLLGEKAVETRRGVARPSNVIHVAASSDAGHPAAFPVALPEWFLRALTDGGDVVYDPFSGSGTTLIAAEKLGRKCRGMELSPAYVDVCVERWQNFTGQQATRE